MRRLIVWVGVLAALAAGCDDGADEPQAADPAVPDAALDQAMPDAAPDQAVADAALDQAVPDAALDLAVADALVDQAAPDAAVDQALPDAAVDQALPDAAVDQAVPDLGPPENPVPPRAPTACAFPPPPAVGGYRTTPAYPGVRFNRPVWVGAAPGDADHLYVVEQQGRIRVIEDRPDVEAAGTFLDRAVSRAGNEEGLLGLAFHPSYADNGRLYVYYSASNPRRSVVSEYRRSPDDPWRADPASERIILEVPQPYSNHNGGDLRFGPDGLLYIGFGDGGSGGDPQNHGQRPTTILGTVARIDVDGDACGGAYGIPPDNPFAANGCAGTDDGLAEVWAWGLRNPWRMAFDPVTGDLWVGDVGQNAWEEVDVVEGGRNYGWNALEGFECYRAGCDPDDPAFTPPVWAVGRGDARSITGGHVHRGPDLPALFGRYLVGDYVTGKIWAIRRVPGAAAEVDLLAQSGLRITSFGADAAGRLRLVAFDGFIHTLVPEQGAEPGAPPPPTLGATGCFDGLAPLTPAAGVAPYALNAPFWSDGARKRRFFAVPDGQAVQPQLGGAWAFPDGSVTIKHFTLPDAEGQPRPVETRFLVRHEGAWRGYSYRWRPDGQEADLVEAGQVADWPTPDGPQGWIHPSRADCLACHTAAAGHTLGLRTAQLARSIPTGDGRTYPQLDALFEAGYLAAPAAAEPPLPAPGGDGPLAERARVWLDVNCAMCHRPDGPGNAAIDLRWATPLADSGVCGPALQGDLGLGDGARLVAPGDAEASVLWRRAFTRGPGQMPPMGSAVVDPEGAALVRAWIEAGACAE